MITGCMSALHSGGIFEIYTVYKYFSDKKMLKVLWLEKFVTSMVIRDKNST